MILVAYDVNTTEIDGVRRLRQVAKVCLDYGQRVQSSVFECSIDPAKFVEIKYKLSKIINYEKDSLRFYKLGKNWENRVEIMGKNETYNPDKDVLIF